jgi:hypothetical protein
VACAHLLAPEAVNALQLLGRLDEPPLPFDLFMLCAALPGSDYSVWLDRSNAEALAARVAEFASVLAARREDLAALGVSGKRLGDGLQRAVLLADWCRLGDAEAVAEAAGVGESDVLMLRQEVLRTLQAAGALFSRDHGALALRIQLAYAMLAAGLEGEQAHLALIPGVGPVYARRLIVAGIDSLDALASQSSADIATAASVSTERAAQWRFAAEALADVELVPAISGEAHCWASDEGQMDGARVDYRAMRATELRVRRLHGDRWHVDGGSEPHLVITDAAGQLECDCPDFAVTGRCKHVLAVHMMQGQDIGEAA